MINPYFKNPTRASTLIITKLNREVQKTTGLDFDQYGKLKIFLAMIWGRALFKKHDSYGGMKNNYRKFEIELDICITFSVQFCLFRES